MADGSSPPPPGHGEDRPATAVAAALEETAAGGTAAATGLGRSELAREANELLRALAHTVRSFILYDAGNERIRGFLEDVRGKVERFLAAHGPLPLEIRPWEIAIGDEVVYADPDRERSLAFRLYRDGVRRLVLQPGMEWSELVSLIGILSVRYKGIRTQEDDVVTLLWRAGFTHVELTAIEGVVASEDDAGQPAPAAGGPAVPRTPLQAAIFDAPYAFTYPWPAFSERAAVQHRPVPASLLARITEEDGEEALPKECIALARELLAEAADPDDPLLAEDVVPMLREMSGFLAGERHVDGLMRLARTVTEMAPPAGPARDELLRACADGEVVRRLIDGHARAGQAASPELIELLSLVPGDHLEPLIDLFAGAPRAQVPPVVVQLLESQVRGGAGRVVERLATLEGERAAELLQIVARGDPAGATDAAVVALARPEEEVQLAALTVLGGAPYGARVGRALVGALASPFPEVRLRAIAALAQQRERRAFLPLLERLRRGAGGEMTAAEARAITAALARLDPEQARPLLREWARPPRLLGRLAPGQALLRRAAVAGLALLPGADSEELLAWLAGHGGDELKGEAEAALAQLRKAPGGSGG